MITVTQDNTVRCSKHGDRREAYLCHHLLHGSQHGFFTDADDALTNSHPDAWCSKCEQIRLAHGGEWNEASEALIEVKLVCGDCYEEIKAINVLETDRSNSYPS